MRLLVTGNDGNCGVLVLGGQLVGVTFLQSPLQDLSYHQVETSMVINSFVAIKLSGEENVQGFQSSRERLPVDFQLEVDSNVLADFQLKVNCKI